jgi:hypothetical protein
MLLLCLAGADVFSVTMTMTMRRIESRPDILLGVLTWGENMPSME